MKFKKSLKYVVPTVGVAALSVSLPLALSSCSSNDEASININGTKLTAQSIKWTYSRPQTYWVNTKNAELPILNGNIFVGNDNSILNTKGVQVTYQWYKNSLPIQNEADANSSQYVVKSIDPKHSDQYFCVVRISYQGKQIAAESPLFIVESSPLTASIEYLDPVKKQPVLGKGLAFVDGFNSQLKAVATSTSADFNLPEEVKAGNVRFEWMKKALLFGQDKIVSQEETFSPTEPGIYYCNITVIKDGQAVTVKTKDEIVAPNTLVSTISTDNSTGVAEKTSTHGNTFYLNTTGNTTLTAKLDSYMGQTPAVPSEEGKDKKVTKQTFNGLYATMWLQKDDIGGYSSNQFGDYKVVTPMSSTNHSLELNNSKAGDYILVEAIYPEGTNPDELDNFNTISALKYTDVQVKNTTNIDSQISHITATQIKEVDQSIGEVTNPQDVLNPESIGYKNLQKTILEELGLTGKANVKFNVINPGQPESLSKDANNVPSTTNVSIKVTLTPANGFTFKDTEIGPFVTQIEKFSVLNGFETLVEQTKKTEIEAKLKQNLNQTNYSKTWIDSVKPTGDIYKAIQQIITGSPSDASYNTKESIPSNSFSMKISFINNGLPTQKVATSESSTGNSSVKIIYTAEPGYVFDDKGTTKLEVIYKNFVDGFVVNPIWKYSTLVTSNIGGIYNTIISPMLNKTETGKTIDSILKQILGNPYVVGTNIDAEIVKLMVGLGGKATIDGGPKFSKGKQYWNVSYTFKTKNKNKWMFPAIPSIGGSPTKETVSISLQTSIPSTQEIPLNAENGWISIPSLTTPNENGVVTTTSKENSVSLGISTSIKAPGFLSSLFNLNYEWYQLNPSGTTLATKQEWTYVSNSQDNSVSKSTLVINNPIDGTKYKCKVWLTMNLFGKKIWVGHAIWSPIYTIKVDSASTGGTGGAATGSESGSSSSSGSSSNTPAESKPAGNESTSYTQFFTTTNKFFKF